MSIDGFLQQDRINDSIHRFKAFRDYESLLIAGLIDTNEG
jgi:hypothetical protein